MSAPQRLLLALLALCTGCRSADVASANLDQLLNEEGGFRYSGKLTSGFDSLLQSVIDPDWLSDDSPLKAEVQSIEDPAGEALKNLLALREGGIDLSGPYLHAEQVRHYARYAVACPSALCRERAFLELGPHAERLGFEEVDLSPDEAANAPELREGIRGLRQVLVDLAADGERDETTRRDFVAACELLGRLELDIEGGRRLLRVIAAFGQLPALDEVDLAPMLALSESVQRRVVSLALTRGRYDPHGIVRAAAYRAHHAVHGPAFLHEALLALRPPRFTEDGQVAVTERFQLLPELLPDRDVDPGPALTVLALLREHGLPRLDEPPEEASGRRLAQLRVLVGIVTRGILDPPNPLEDRIPAYPDRVRVQTMRTLGVVSGAGFASLREEDWARWWNEHRAAETERLEQRARELEASGEVGGDGA